MKNLFPIIYIASFLTTYAQTQWTKCNGPFGGLIGGLGMQNKTLYVCNFDYFSNGPRDYIFYSINSGNTWSKLDLGSTFNIINRIQSIDCNDDILCLYTDQGVIISSDSGESWDTTQRRSIVRYNLSKSTLLRQDTNNKIFRSLDKGNTWTQTNLPRPSSGQLSESLVEKETHVYAANGHKTLFISSDSGITWDSVGIGIDYPIRYVSTTDSAIVAFTDNGVYFKRTNDLTFIHSNSYINNIRGIATINNILYVTQHGYGLLKSSDDGRTWTPVKALNKYITHLKNSSDTLFAGTGNGMFRITNEGETWELINEGLLNQKVEGIFEHDNRTFVTALDCKYVSTDTGETWSRKSLPRNIHSHSFTNSAHFFVEGNWASEVKQTLYRSYDNLETYSAVDIDDIHNSRIKTLCAYDSILVVALDTTVIKISTNNGEAWNSINLPGFLVEKIQIVNRNLYVITTNGEFKISNDVGKNWITSPLYLITQSSIIAKESAILINTLNFLYRSFDNGRTWDSIPRKFNHPYNFVVNNNIILAGSPGDSLLYYSSDYASSWQSISVPERPLVPQFIGLETAYFTDNYDNSIWRCNISSLISTTSLVDGITSIGKFKLFPNPSDGNIIIELSTKLINNAYFGIVNSVGETVLSGIIQSHTKTHIISTEDLPKGMYLLHIETESSRIYEKFIVN